jgi:hypothetical protein
MPRIVRRAAGLIAAVSMCLAAAMVQAREAGPHIRAAVPDAAMVGSGRFTWFGFHVYDGALFAPAGKYQAPRPFALELTYARALKGADIARRSIDEIAKLNIGTEAEHAQWLPVLTNLFPDVRENDRLTGVARGESADFFFNGKPVGAINDPKLMRAFFSIWLDERTSAPGFRKKLLGIEP